MEKEYAIGIDLGGTSVKYALIDNEGVFYFQGKLPSKADESAEAVIGQLVTAINEAKAFAQEKGYKIDGIGIGTPGIVDCTNRVVLGGAETSTVGKTFTWQTTLKQKPDFLLYWEMMPI